MIKVSVEWASPADRLDNSDFNLERKEKLDQMESDGRVPEGGRPKGQNNSPVGVVLFNTQEAANEWKRFIVLLAAKYNKTLVNITDEELANVQPAL